MVLKDDLLRGGATTYDTNAYMADIVETRWVPQEPEYDAAGLSTALGKGQPPRTISC